MARVLVTGGQGFIGTNLVRELRSRRHEVRSIDLFHAESPDHDRVDISSFCQLSEYFQQHAFDYVYHLAAEYGRWNGERHYENLWRTNVIGTKNLLRLQESMGFRQIFFSSCEVYGDYDGLMTEDVMDTTPIKQMNDYAISKWAGELQVLNSASMFGTETVRVRPLNCYGPHEHFSPYRGVIPIMVYRALNGEKFVAHDGHLRIFDYVDDSVRTIANILDNFLPGEVYNIGSDEKWQVDIVTLAKMVLKATGMSLELLEVRESEAHTTRVKIVDLTKSRKDLGHQALIDLEQGLCKYVAWMRASYGLGAK